MKSKIKAVAMFALFALGTFLVVSSIEESQIETVMPLPSNTFEFDPHATIPKTDEVTEGSVEPAPIDVMPDGSIAIPDIGIIATFENTGSFSESRYANFNTLDVPEDPKLLALYSGGSKLSSDSGVSLIAGHVSRARVKGALYSLYTISSGATITTKDEDGQVREWTVTKLWYADHLDFPQEYFSKDGPRKLVLVTCGGNLNKQGYYEKNVFVEAVLKL